VFEERKHVFNTVMLQLSFGGRIESSTFQLSGMQTREREDAQKEVAEGTHD
jgi:hypothetical protein